MADTQAQADGTQREGEQGRQFGVVFFTTVAISAVFVLAGVFFTDPFGTALATVVGWITQGLGWWYMLVTSFFLGFAVWLAFSRYGKIRLGQPDDKPEFGYFPWFAMLFQAGMGIGLVFWSVSEPVTHYADPPLGLAEPKTPEAAVLALQTTFFHWGLHPWAIYAVVGLAVAYFSYRRGMSSLKISTVFRPLIGDQVDGPVGKAIDVIAIIATLFGVAVSLGLGTLQIDAGLGKAFGLPSGIVLQLGIIAVTVVAYMLSASTPIHKGINFLAQTSMYVAFALLIYFFVVGPTLLQLNTFTQETGTYLANLVPQSFRMAAFEPQETAWLADWTIFFWATWIAWAPYVGVFIARISRGRTIREFILGVMIAPTIFSMIWFSVFGAAAIQTDNQTNGAISSAAGNSEALGLFAYLAQNPLFLFTAISMIFLVWIFFVAGADAGTVVLGSMSSAEGVLDPKRMVKLTWGLIMGGLAAILLMAGGLDALQNGAILAATPFSILMILMSWCLYKTLRADYREEREQIREIMAHDQNVEKQQMQEIMRRHEAGEPVEQKASSPYE